MTHKLPRTYEAPSLIDDEVMTEGVFDQLEKIWKDSKFTDEQILSMGGNRSGKTKMSFELTTGLKWDDVFDEGLED